MGRRRGKSGRNVHGILLLDKPPGTGSNSALQQVKRLFRARKAGHTGSLDSAASGMLPLCFGEATKISGFLLDADKHYRATCRLGVTTTTGDAEGEVVETRPVEAYPESRIREVLESFHGRIEQVPPMFSAIKHQGRPLYELAYQGIEVERKARTITIHELTLLGHGPDTLELEIRCSKGTYIRTLAEQIGGELGCGAHVQTLRRLGAGPFEASGMVTMERVEQAAAQGLAALDALLIPMDAALSAWPDITLNDDSAYYLRKGQPVLVPHAPTRGWVRLYTRAASFIGVGQVLDDGRIAPKRLVNA